MSSVVYSPETGSLVHRVCQWFLTHKRDFIVPRDVMRIFNVATSHVVRKQLEPGIEHGYLVETGSGTDCIYSPGPRLDQLTALPSTTNPIGGLMATTPSTTTPKRAPTKPLPAIDISKIAIEKGVEKPPPKGSSLSIYRPLIDKLQPGESVLLPHEHAKRMLDWAKKLSSTMTPAPKWSIRKIDGVNSRVWRDA